MSLLDVLVDFADVLLTRRLALALAAGLLGAVAAHALLEPPLAARVGLLAIVAGLVAGIAWEYRHRHDSGP